MNRLTLGLVALLAIPALAGSPPGLPRQRPAVTVPIRHVILPWDTPAPGGSPKNPPPAHCPVILHGSNAAVTSVELASDYAVERGYHIVVEIANSGTNDLSNILIRFYLGDPDSGGVQIGDDLVIASLASGAVTRDSTHWNGFTGTGVVCAVADPCDEVTESDESDNRATTGVSLRDDVPWVWQVVNGYCNYASLTMQFNFLGCDHTLYETVEFTSVPHSALAIDDRFYLPGGLYICQTESDYRFAGTIRNLNTDFAFLGTWSAYLAELRSRADAGQPPVTSVDPYYLPQPDYDVLREYGLHGGHAVVVTGYTDSAVIINDPGVGLEFIEPGLPEPEKRGADVVVDLATFQQAVENTSGGVYVLISYSPRGPLPPEDEIRTAAFYQSIDRLEGASYDPGLSQGWPEDWFPVFGMAAFDSVQGDMAVQTFTAWFNEVHDYTGGDLEQTITFLASAFGDGMFWTQLGWEASAEYFATVGTVDADGMAAMSRVLADRAGAIFDTYIALLWALINNGGDPSDAGPYLADMAQDLADVNELEPEVRATLMRMVGMAGDGPTIPAFELRVTAFPNPFTSYTHIRWNLPGDAPARIGVYDMAGRLIQTLRPVDGTITWDGKDAAARLTSPGAYVIRDSEGRSLRLVRME
ncbi:MAG: C39 family peptidase [Candidatus Eisenbacteria bacterium]|nr:C39 family peptidase [Candidatus Eisenbacteria bacterium]